MELCDGLRQPTLQGWGSQKMLRFKQCSDQWILFLRTRVARNDNQAMPTLTNSH